MGKAEVGMGNAEGGMGKAEVGRPRSRGMGEYQIQMTVF